MWFRGLFAPDLPRLALGLALLALTLSSRLRYAAILLAPWALRSCHTSAQVLKIAVEHPGLLHGVPLRLGIFQLNI